MSEDGEESEPFLDESDPLLSEDSYLVTSRKNIEKNSDCDDDNEIPSSGGAGISTTAWACVAVVSLAFFVDNFAAMIILPVVPELQNTVEGASNELDGGLLLAAYGMLYIVGSLFAGPAQEMLGNLRLMMLSFMLLLVATLLMMLHEDYTTLFASRMLQGLASATHDVAATALLVRYVTGNNALAFGIVGAFCNLGLVAGPLAGGYLYSAGGWHLITITLVIAFVLDGVGRVALSILVSEELEEIQPPSAAMLVNYGNTGRLLFSSRECCGVLAAVFLNWTIIYGVLSTTPWAFKELHGTSSTDNSLIAILFVPALYMSPFSGLIATDKVVCMWLVAASFLLHGVGTAMLGCRLSFSAHLVAISLMGTGSGILVPAAKELLRLSAKDVLLEDKHMLSSIWVFYFLMQGLAMEMGHIGVSALAYVSSFKVTMLTALMPLAVVAMLAAITAAATYDRTHPKPKS